MPTLTRPNEFFVLRASRKGKASAQCVGCEWPAGAKVSPRLDRYAMLFPDGRYRLMRDSTLDDVLTEAAEKSANGQSVQVLRVAGEWGGANLYETVSGIETDEDPASRMRRIQKHWADIARKKGREEGDLVRFQGTFKVLEDDEEEDEESENARSTSGRRGGKSEEDEDLEQDEFGDEEDDESEAKLRTTTVDDHDHDIPAEGDETGEANGHTHPIERDEDGNVVSIGEAEGHGHEVAEEEEKAEEDEEEKSEDDEDEEKELEEDDDEEKSEDDEEDEDEETGAKTYRTSAYRPRKGRKNSGDGSLRVSGFASTPDIDRDFDIVLPTAFEEKIDSYVKNPVGLFMHDPFTPTGVVEEITVVPEKGIKVVYRVEDEQVKRWVKAGLLKTFSIQFLIDDSDFQEPKAGEIGPIARVIKKGELLETSIVTIPANPKARFEVSKAMKRAGKSSSRCCSGLNGICECDSGEASVEFRSFKVASKGSRYDSRSRTIAAKFGRNIARLCHAIDDSEFGLDLQHSAIVGSELKTIPELVRCSMARLLAGDVDMSSSDRKAAHATLGRRWMQAFREAPPALHKSTKQFAKTLGKGVVALAFSKSLFGSAADAKDWAESRGFKARRRGFSADRRDYRILLADADLKEASELRSVDLAEGVQGFFAIRPSTKETKMADEDTIRRLIREEVNSGSSSPKGGKKEADEESRQRGSGGDDDGASDELLTFDDKEEVEVDLETLTAVQAAANGEGVDDDTFDAAQADAAQALGLDSE